MSYVRLRSSGKPGLRPIFIWSDGDDAARRALYLEKLHKGLREKDGQPIPNASTPDYQLFVEFMFHKCRLQARFVSCSFDPNVYGKPELINSAKKFLSERGRSIELLIEDSSFINNDHEFFAMFQGHPGFTTRVIRPDVTQLLNINFSLFDDDAYRLEPNKAMSLGVVAFGDAAGFATLNDLYRKLRHFSAPLGYKGGSNNDLAKKGTGNTANN